MSDHDPAHWPKLAGLIRGIGAAKPIFFDVGANCGDFSARLLEEFPGCFVHAVEPDRRLCEQLRRHLPEDRARIWNVALGSRPEQRDFLVHDNPATSSLLARPAGARRYFHSSDRIVAVEKVRVTTLDAVAAEAGVDQIHLLKLDTQGSERPILDGAHRLLSRAAVDVIYTEFFVVPHYEGAALLHELWAILAAHGYRLYDLFKGPYGRNGQLRFGDAIFVSPRVGAAYLDLQPDEA